MSGAVEIFISYAHEDVRMLDELMRHLNPMANNGLIKVWHEGCIQPGEDTAKEIKKHWNSAPIILLLISPNYMASHYSTQEVSQAMVRHRKGVISVIPILLRPIADWQKSLFRRPELLLFKGKSVEENRSNRGKAYASIAQSIMEVVEEYNPSKRLYKSLIDDLDYGEQTELFQNLFMKNDNQNRVGAFIVHGAMDNTYNWKGYSLRSFLTRLVNITSTVDKSDSDAKPVRIFIDLYSPYASSDVNVLWFKIAGDMGVELNLRTKDWDKKIIGSICKRLESKNVIIVISGIDNMEQQQFLYPLIQQLWMPLANAAHNLKLPYLLLMLLVDCNGRHEDWSISCTESSDDQSWKPDPIRLRRVTNFSSHDLKKWINAMSERLFYILPADLREGTPEERVERILGKTNNGDPDRVMYHICEQCDSFIGGMDSWLKL